MSKHILLIFILLLSSPAAWSAKWVDEFGKPMPDSNSIKSAKNFLAQLVLTTDEKTLLKNWAIPSKTVNLPTSLATTRNKAISAFIIFSGCKVNPSGHCELEVTFTIYQPDGKIYAHITDMEVWFNRPVPPNRALQLSKAYLKITIQDGEPLGNYKIESVVTDRRSNETVTLSSVFKVTE